MRKSLYAVLLAIAMLPLATANAQDMRDEGAMRAIVAGQVIAWNAGDGTRYARDIAPGASFTNQFGAVTYGATAFADRHTEMLATLYKGTRKKLTVRRIRFLTPDVAIVDIDNEVYDVKAMPGASAVPPDGVMRTQLMEVFVRRDGRWWVEAHHDVGVKLAVARP